MNLNKLFPRLSIRAKLAIAFVLLALVPLVVTGSFGTQVTLRTIRAHTQATLVHDLETARQETELSLQQAERSVAYLARHVLGPPLAAGDRAGWEERGRAVSAFLSFAPELFRIKVVDAGGRQLLVARTAGTEPRGADGEESGGTYYASRASVLRHGQHLILPVELRGTETDGKTMTTIPAVAILVTIRETKGGFRGVVVGEAYASSLFAALELGSPHVRGVTGLVDADGLFLYHSERKRNWANLLASRSEVDLTRDVPAEVSRAILSGGSGTMLTPGGAIVSFLPLHLSEPTSRPFMLYRAVPLAVLEDPARRFLHGVATGGLAALVLVLGLAVLAAHQFTRPIYQLREGAKRLAQGRWEPPVRVQTNDELEDLAGDFSAMAHRLADQRQRLEELVEERTSALGAAHAELTGILEHSADAIIGLDFAGRIRVWNRGAEKLFGYSMRDAAGRSVDELLLPPGEEWKAESVFIQREVARTGAVVNFRTERAGRDGKPRSVSLTQTVMRDEEGCPLGFSLIIRDIRQQAMLEEQMRHSERLAAVAVMASGVAHELGNPLAVIANRIECMEREVRDRGEGGFLADDMAVLREHAERLGSVIRDVLDFAHDAEDQRDDVGLNEVAGRVTNLLQRTYVAREVTLETRLDSELPPCTGNEKALETVCMNLLLNALDATPSGGTIIVQTRRASAAGWIELEVRDTGRGIPEALRHRIFEPFFTTKTRGRGTGLGLSVCRSIVERHGGRIRVESREGRGSCFVVSLPIRREKRVWRSLAYS